jgi:hypothetical protein
LFGGVQNTIATSRGFSYSKNTNGDPTLTFSNFAGTQSLPDWNDKSLYLVKVSQVNASKISVSKLHNAAYEVRAFHSMHTWYNGTSNKLLLVGGIALKDDSGTAEVKFLPNAVLVTLNSTGGADSFTALTPPSGLSFERFGIASCHAPQANKIFFYGGYTSLVTVASTSSSLFQYSTTTGQFSSLQFASGESLPALAFATLTCLNDTTGAFYVLGGSNGNAASTTAQYVASNDGGTTWSVTTLSATDGFSSGSVTGGLAYASEEAGVPTMNVIGGDGQGGVGLETLIEMRGGSSSRTSTFSISTATKDGSVIRMFMAGTTILSNDSIPQGFLTFGGTELQFAGDNSPTATTFRVYRMCDKTKFAKGGSDLSCNGCKTGTFNNYVGSVGSCASCPVAKYASTTSSSTCQSCPAGTAGKSTGLSVCSNCTAGSYSGIEQSVCTSCTAGTYTNLVAATGCLKCSAGAYQPSDGASICATCNSGSFSGIEESASCVACGIDQYNPDTAATACLTCPGGSFTDIISATLLTKCQCPSGKYGTVDSTTSTCANCPTGGDCPGGDVIRAAAGYYSSPSSSDVFRECIPTDACAGDDGCTEGYTGFMCGSCDVGYYRSGETCESCPFFYTLFYTSVYDFGLINITIGILLVLSLVGTVALLFSLILILGGGDSQGDGSGAKWSILVNLLQITAMYGRLQLNWPTLLTTIFSFSAIFNFGAQAAGEECALQIDFYSQRYLFYGTPILFALIFIGLFPPALAISLYFTVRRQKLRKKILAQMESDVISALEATGDCEMQEKAADLKAITRQTSNTQAAKSGPSEGGLMFEGSPSSPSSNENESQSIEGSQVFNVVNEAVISEGDAMPLPSIAMVSTKTVGEEDEDLPSSDKESLNIDAWPVIPFALPPPTSRHITHGLEEDMDPSVLRTRGEAHQMHQKHVNLAVSEKENVGTGIFARAERFIGELDGEKHPLWLDFRMMIFRFCNAYIMLLLMLYAFIVSSAFEVFQCQPQTDGSYTQVAAPSNECFVSSWYPHAVAAVVVLLAYGILLPVAAIAMLFMGRHHFDSPPFRQFCGALYLRYEPEFYFWEAVVIVRKFGIAFVVVFPYVLIQVVIGLCVLFVGLLLEVFARPFHDTNDDRLETICLVDLIITLFCGFIFYSSTIPDTASYYILMAIVVVSLVFAFTAVLMGILLDFVQYAELTMHRWLPLATFPNVPNLIPKFLRKERRSRISVTKDRIETALTEVYGERECNIILDICKRLDLNAEKKNVLFSGLMESRRIKTQLEEELKAKEKRSNLDIVPEGSYVGSDEGGNVQEEASIEMSEL